MPKINKRELSSLYLSSEINDVWRYAQNLAVIDHPDLGKISPNHYRSLYNKKPCPFCGKKMVHGLNQYSTGSKQVAIARGYQYTDTNGYEVINQAGNTFFHPNYVTLDHKINKARCPDLMFDYKNLQIICWKCNQGKSDNNTFELQHSLSHITEIAKETIKKYFIS